MPLRSELGHGKGAKDSTKRVGILLAHVVISSCIGIPSYWDCAAVIVIGRATMSGARREPCQPTRLSCWTEARVNKGFEMNGSLCATSGCSLSRCSRKLSRCSWRNRRLYPGDTSKSPQYEQAIRYACSSAKCVLSCCCPVNEA